MLAMAKNRVFHAVSDAQEQYEEYIFAQQKPQDTHVDDADSSRSAAAAAADS